MSEPAVLAAAGVAGFVSGASRFDGTAGRTRLTNSDPQGRRNGEGGLLHTRHLYLGSHDVERQTQHPEE